MCYIPGGGAPRDGRYLRSPLLSNSLSLTAQQEVQHVRKIYHLAPRTAGLPQIYSLAQFGSDSPLSAPR